jgi:putative flippase GtrA
MKFHVFAWDFSKFITAGVVNTLLSYAVYLLLILWIPYRLSYTISYAAGIAIAYASFRFFVFKREGGRWGLFWVAAIYLLQYLLGLALIDFWVQRLNRPEEWAPAFAIAVSLPLTYFLSSYVFRPREH